MMMSDSPPVQRTLREKTEQFVSEVLELIAIDDARAQLAAGFNGMGVNILGEKAARMSSQRRRVLKIANELDALLTDPVATPDRCCDLTVTHTHGVLRADGTFTADPSED
jgi:hypothetical protein